MCMNGSIPILYDMDGTPSLPAEMDDVYLNSQGSTSQPADAVSLRVGHVAVIKIFRILSQCHFRQRLLATDSDGCLDKSAMLAWTDASSATVTKILVDLPDEFRSSNSGVFKIPHAHTRRCLSMQWANIQITALCVRFALVSDPATAVQDLTPRLSIVGLQNKAQSRIRQQSRARDDGSADSEYSAKVSYS